MSSTIVFNGTSYSIPAEGDSSWGTDLTNYLVAIASGSLQKTGGNFTLTADVNFGTNFGLKAQYIKSQGTNPASAGVLRLANAESIKWRNQANNADLDLTVNISNVLQFNGSNVLSAGAASIVNADVSPSAAIAYSKLNLSSSIVNADISNSAAIAYSKLNLATSIVNADISASAAIAYSKLNLSTSIVNADISASAAIAYSKLNLATSILNADINASAAIARSKLAALTASRVMVTDGSGFDSASSITTTTLGYLDPTSSVQTQLDAKVAKTLTTTTGDMIYASSANTPARLPIGSSGQVIKSVGGIPTWATFSGGINYLSANPDAESDTSGWATYADAAGTSPVDGTGGSPNSTWTRTTSSPLRGSGSFLFTRNSGASRQGEGVSYAFTIDTADKAKVLQVEFDYLLASGAFTAGTTSTDSELTVWLYDVTNSLLIQPSTYKLYSSNTTIPDKFIGNFQTASNSTSYRLIIHVGSTTNAAFTMQFDNFKVGPCNYVYGTPITDWQSFTGTSGASNSTYSGYWRRVGGNAEIKSLVSMTGAPGGTFGPTLPTEIPVPDTTKMPSGNAALGVAWGIIAGLNQRYTGTVLYNSSTNVVITGPSAAGAWGTNIPGNNWASGDFIYLTFSYPVSGWSSSVQQSDSWEGRQITVTAENNANVSAGNGSTTKMTFGSKIYDSTNSWNTSTNTFTAPSAGYYRVTAVIGYPGTSGTGSRVNLIYKNGSNYSQVGIPPVTDGGATQVTNSIEMYLNAGDTVEIYALQTGGGSMTLSGTNNRLNITKLQSPSTISATEVVAFMAEGASSSALGSNTVIPFNTPSHDTHAGWNSTNKDWAAPYSGYYKVFFQMRVTSGGTPSVNQYLDAIIQVDTVTKREFVKYIENTGVAGWEANVSWQGWLNAGQKIRAIGDTNITSPSLTTGATHTFLEIFRIK